jgi:hypothetical protein
VIAYEPASFRSDELRAVRRRSDNEAVTPFVILGSILTALGLALCTDAMHRRVPSDDPAYAARLSALKWAEFSLGVGLLCMGVTVLAFAVTG